jgi:hypothetical protein
VKVRLKAAATVKDPVHGTHWHPAGAEVDIPHEHYDAALHENLEVPAADEPLEVEPLEEVELPEDEEGAPEHGTPRKRK